METSLNSTLFIGSILLLISIFLSKSSPKFGLPILVMFVFVGMLAGSEGIGKIEYENYELTHGLSLIAICIIIFTGGLQTNLKNAKVIVKSGTSLASLGVFLATVIVAAFCYYLFKISIIQSLLLGAILSSTDAAAIFSIFKDKKSQVHKKVKNVVELESGSNDPMAYFLITIFIGFYQQIDRSPADYALMFILNPLVGSIGGYLLFKLFKFINNHLVLDFQGLYPALTIGFLFLTYSGVTKLGGNGFLAIYVFGILLGDSKIPHKKVSISFFDGASWLFQIGLFVLLGLLVQPSRLIEAAPYGVALALFIQFVARPISVFLSLCFSNFTGKEKILISWAGLKGATQIVFASFAATYLGDQSHFIFDVVFFSVLISALFQGSTIKILARKLNLLYEVVFDPDFPIDFEVFEKTKNGIKEYTIMTEDYAVGKRIVDLKLPSGTLVLFIKRSGHFLIPDGSTMFETSDKVLIVSSEKSDIPACIEGFQSEFEDLEKLLQEDRLENPAA